MRRCWIVEVKHRGLQVGRYTAWRQYRMTHHTLLSAIQTCFALTMPESGYTPRIFNLMTKERITAERLFR